MPTILSTLLPFVIEECIKLEPAIANEIKTLFASGNPTADDFAALRAKIASGTFENLCPNSAEQIEASGN